tara:strand:+ start:555 stop:734 length:180 start_codon:yes stop_codon:yes gene_type:complete
MECKGITKELTKEQEYETITERALKLVINNKPAKKVYAYSITELINNQKKSFNENNKLK